MSKKKIFAALNEVSKSLKQITNNLVQTIEHDYVCGVWIAEFSDHTATIIKMNTGYMATVRYRGQLAEQMFIVPKEEVLEINDCAGSRPSFVYHDPERQTLFLGRYGRFYREVEHDFDCLAAMEAEEDFHASAVQLDMPLGIEFVKGKKQNNSKKKK